LTSNQITEKSKQHRELRSNCLSSIALLYREEKRAHSNNNNMMCALKTQSQSQLGAFDSFQQIIIAAAHRVTRLRSWVAIIWFTSQIHVTSKQYDSAVKGDITNAMQLPSHIVYEKQQLFADAKSELMIF